MLAGGQQAIFSVSICRIEMMKKLHFLAVTHQKLRGGIDFIAGRHLIQMADVGLDRKIAAACGKIIGINTYEAHHRVGGYREAVEIAGFVHMAVIVGPGRRHLLAHGLDRLIDVLAGGGRRHRVVKCGLPGRKGAPGTPVICLQRLHDSDKIVITDAFQLTDRMHAGLHVGLVGNGLHQLVQTISDQSDVQSGMHSIRELERIRDDNLVAIMQALKANDWGAGRTLSAWETALYDAVPAATTGKDINQPIETMRQQVPAAWTDYNGHMNEARYLDCFSIATDAMMRLVGVDADYLAAGSSYFTVETHIRHLDEVTAGNEIYATSQLLMGDGKKMQLFHHLYAADADGEDRLLATGEHMLIHVDMNSRSSSLPSDAVAAKLAELAAAHEKLPRPEGAGRAIGG